MSSYAYVGGNPVTYVDPTGLTKWNIGMFSVSGGKSLFEAGYIRFMAISQCQNGKMTLAYGNILFGGAAFGTPLAFSGSNTEVDDGIPGNLDPSVLEGLYVYQGAGGALGGGGSYSKMRIGQATSGSYSWGAQGGLGGGFSSDYGRSWVTSSATFNIH